MQEEPDGIVLSDALAPWIVFELDRIDGTPLPPMLRPERVSVRADEAMIGMRLSADHEFELYFPAPDGTVQSAWLALAADVLAHLTEMDNEVQRESAKQLAGSPYPGSYFAGELAYITLIKPREAVLHYFVIGCNSEWDERFVRVEGCWSRVKHAEPGAIANHENREPRTENQHILLRLHVHK